MVAKSKSTVSAGLKLEVTTADGVEEYALDTETVTVGRATTSNLPIRDGRASRQHLKIEPIDDGWRVVDLGSQNGTYLNGRRVRRSSLKVGDVIRIGSTKLVVAVQVPEVEVSTDTATDLRVAEGAVLAEAPDDLHADMLLNLQKVARALNSELNVESLLNLIIDQAIGLTGAERGFLIMIGKNEMEFRVARNFERKEVGAPEFAVSWSIATQVSSSGQAVLCVNAAEDDRFATNESVLALGLRSVMCVPFKVRSRVLGVIYVDNRLHKGAFSRADFRILEILADHAAIALENARLYGEVLEKKQALETRNHELNLQVAEQGSRLEAAVGPVPPSDLIGKVGVRGAFIGESPAMREVLALVRKVASSDLPVLVTGESGTGKEVVAQTVHRLSERHRQSIVSENCCAIPETLLESELFGYKKGAFTGAQSDRSGLFETASGGTLFLDEIGDMSLNLQTKLLRVLQEGEVRPLGSKEPIQVDVRLITATNQDLAALIDDKRFREDLFYRIKVVSIVVPPLRRRKEDIPLLLDHFLTLFAAEAGEPKKSLSKEALEVLQAYEWPGNVRELENEVRTMASWAEVVVEKTDIPAHIHEQVELLVGEESGFHDLNALVESIESREIGKALRRTRVNKTKAASLLGISRFALQRKMDKYGIDPVDTSDADAK